MYHEKHEHERVPARRPGVVREGRPNDRGTAVGAVGADDEADGEGDGTESDERGIDRWTERRMRAPGAVEARGRLEPMEAAEHVQKENKVVGRVGTEARQAD